MRRSILMVLGLALAATPLRAATFGPAPLAPEAGLDALNRAVARSRLGRDVFARPYATVTISHVDLYDRFPYVESRRFEVVSDPAWSRLVAGEPGVDLVAYDGAGGPLGPLASPHGLAVDEADRVYVADTGNDRVVVLQAAVEFDHVALTPLYEIRGLSAPYAVAVSDNGTPFQTGDDVLFVADAGKNRVAAYALGAGGARALASIGTLGSGPGHFAGPLAIAVGRADGASTSDVYVADAHNGRIVRLRWTGGAFAWVEDAPVDAGVVTALDTDQWGNLYAAAPQRGVVRKFNAALQPVADLGAPLGRPLGVHVPFAAVSDHRDGSTRLVGQPDAVTVDDWGGAGVRAWSLGVSVDGLAVSGGDAPVARFTLTDRAAVTLQVLDAAGAVMSARTLPPLEAGPQAIALTPADLRGADGLHELTLRVSAASSYAGGAGASASAAFRASGGAAALPSRAALLGSWPNPARGAAHVVFELPADGAATTLTIYDAGGRRVRRIAGPFGAGRNDVLWDGADERGVPVHAGLYFVRLEDGAATMTRRLVLVR